MFEVVVRRYLLETYRSVFMWYMWRVEDVDISTFDN